MLKNGLTNFLLIVLVFVVIATNMYMYNEINTKNEGQTVEEKVIEEIAVDNQKNLDEELLREKIENSNRFVKNISNQTEIILLNENGEFTIRHDRTPENNQLNEWLVNAELTMKLDYRAIFSIKSSDIDFDITNDGKIIAKYDTSNIIITAIEVSNVTPTQKTSIFGTKYKPTEVAALEKIAKEKLLEKAYSNENILKASDNLKSFINDLAKKFSIEEISIIADNEDIYIEIVEVESANAKDTDTKGE